MKNSLLDDDEVLGNRASFAQQDEGDYYGFNGQAKESAADQNGGGEGGADPFGFNTYVAKKFLDG